MIRLSLVVIAVALLAGAPMSVRAAAPLPKGLLFVGLIDGEWRMLTVEADGKLRRVNTVSQPRTPAYSASFARASYISDAGELREIELTTGRDTALLSPTDNASYTQPTYRAGTDELYVVVLRDGSSIETDLARVDRVNRKPITVLHQRSAQFEPAFTGDGARLIYSNVHCASECLQIIQEIWSMDVASGVPRQITLLNAVSRQPAADASGDIVFASNANGHYQLWRVPSAGVPRQLTNDAALDESPAAAPNGDIYFVRRSASGARLMRLSVQGEISEIALDSSIADVRDVRWGR